MVKPLFPEHLVKLIRGEQVMKTVKRRRKQSNRYMQAIYCYIYIRNHSNISLLLLFDDSTVPENVAVPYPGKEPENKGVKKIENTEK